MTFAKAALDKRHRSTEAMEQYHIALGLKSDYAEAFNNLGLDLLSQGHAGEAIDYFQRAIHTKPDYAEPYNNLGCVWAAQGTNLDEARDLVTTANKLDPDNASILDSLGWVLLKLNRPAEGLPYQIRAVAHSPQPDASLYEHLGDLYAALHERDQAVQAWRQSLAISPTPAVQTKLAAVAVP